MMDIPANAKYAIIQETSRRADNLLSIKQLCSLAGVSRSGYYHNLSTEENRQRRERQDQEDFQWIVEAYQFRGYAKGARGIYMRLIHMEPPMVMNIKKIESPEKMVELDEPLYTAEQIEEMLGKITEVPKYAPLKIKRMYCEALLYFHTCLNLGCDNTHPSPQQKVPAESSLPGLFFVQRPSVSSVAHSPALFISSSSSSKSWIRNLGLPLVSR